ncbi:hypothetical protein N7527_000204 [Penicillium freii]|nr:hypothetical protein N7527_000204 [Penicillium freii]
MQEHCYLGRFLRGVSTSHYLLKHVVPQLPKKASYQVILISTSSQAICRPAWPRALISDDIFPQEKLFVGVPQQFEQCPEDSFRFIQGTATKLDHHDRYSLRATWETFREALPNVKHIVIAGGGLTGVETAGELGEYLNGGADRFSSKLENPKVTITLVTAGSKILPVLRTRYREEGGELPRTGTESALTTNATWCAIGDVGSHARPAVHNILNTVPTLCANIKRDLLLAEEKEESTVGADRVFKEDTGAAMGFQ